MFKKPTFKNITHLIIGLAALCLTSQAMAGITITKTRVVYPLTQTDVSVQLNNQSSSPSLSQAWIDEGDPNSTPGESKAPFFITPAIFRMEANSSKMLRIVYTGKSLPTDHESLFWLNVLDVPPNEKSVTNRLQFAFRTRIKLFVRPAGLKGNIKEAVSQLRWKAASAQKSGESAMTVTNSSPYYLSFSEFAVQSEGQTLKNDKGGMVAPFSTSILSVTGQKPLSSGAKVTYNAIGDLGEALPGSATLN